MCNDYVWYIAKQIINTHLQCLIKKKNIISPLGPFSVASISMTNTEALFDEFLGYSSKWLQMYKIITYEWF